MIAKSNIQDIRASAFEVDDLLKREASKYNPTSLLKLQTEMMKYDNTAYGFAKIMFDSMRHRQLYYQYPNIIWSSLFLSAYGYFESALDILSDYYFEKKELDIKPRDLRYTGLKRSEFYLLKVARIKFPANKHNWDSINKVAPIRHCLIHANGVIEQSNESEKIKSIVKDCSKLEVNEAK